MPWSNDEKKIITSYKILYMIKIVLLTKAYKRKKNGTILHCHR